MTTAAAIDRLVHHSVIVELNILSYRQEWAYFWSKTLPIATFRKEAYGEDKMLDRFYSPLLRVAFFSGARAKHSTSRENVITSTFKNTLLCKFDEKIIERLNLKPVKFELLHEIEYPGNAIDNLFFVEEGMASMTTTFKDGSQVEVGMFGYESVIGVSALMGSRRSLNRVYTQIAGSGYSCAIADGRAEFKRGGLFQTIVLRYVQAQLLQVAQSAGCNMTHEVGQRLARWLLICADRGHRDDFAMTQDSLAIMLGVHRPTISIAADSLKSARLIDYRHGKMKILDRRGLEHRACECYRVIKDHLDNYADFAGGVE